MTAAELPRGVYRHGKRFRIDRRIDGHRVQRTFESMEEAIAFLRLTGTSHASHAASLSVADVIDEWFAEHQHALTPGPRRDYGYRVSAIKKAVGDADVRDLVADRRPIEVFLRTLPLPTRKKTHTVLVQALEHAVWKREIGANPARGIRIPKHRKKPLDIPTALEVALMATTATMTDELWGLFVRLSAALGTRRGETCALRWEDFDFDRGEVLIRRNAVKADGGLTFKVPKSGEVRSLRIRAGEFWEELLPHRREAGFLFEGVHNGSRRPNPGRCWYPDVPGRRFVRLVDHLSIVSRYGAPYRLHSLRHYVATQMYLATKDWVQVARFMGHLTPSMTIELYANHFVDDAQERLGDVAAELFTSASAPVLRGDAL